MVFRQVITNLANISTRNNINKHISAYTVAANVFPISSKPLQTRFATLKVCLTVIPFVILGATISKNAARILEEQEIFVPEDDEDD